MRLFSNPQNSFIKGVGGYDGDGDIFKEDNLIEFKKFVVENSDNKGVYFVMADGVWFFIPFTDIFGVKFFKENARAHLGGDYNNLTWWLNCNGDF